MYVKLNKWINFGDLSLKSTTMELPIAESWKIKMVEIYVLQPVKNVSNG